MSTKIPENLYKEFLKVLEGGNEEKARDFIISHLKDFPDEVREKIIVAFFKEALVAAKDDAKLLSDFQKQGLEVGRTIEQAKKLLEMKEKI